MTRVFHRPLVSRAGWTAHLIVVALLVSASLFDLPEIDDAKFPATSTAALAAFEQAQCEEIKRPSFLDPHWSCLEISKVVGASGISRGHGQTSRLLVSHVPSQRGCIYRRVLPRSGLPDPPPVVA
jgi:hypothetical protein